MTYGVTFCMSVILIKLDFIFPQSNHLYQFVLDTAEQPRLPTG